MNKWIIIYVSTSLASTGLWADEGTESANLQSETDSSFRRAGLNLVKMTRTPTIDGELNAGEWDEAAKVTDFVVFRPNVGDKPQYTIDAYIGYDEHYLYVAAQINQPLATITDRVLIQGNSIWDEDYFGITLDTNFDKRDAYLFHVTPSGIREDGLVDGTDYIGQWSTLWYAKTSQFEQGWRVEMAIPMQSISFDKNIETWGIQLRHKLSSPDQQVYWNLNNNEAGGWTAGQVAPISGLKGLEQGLGIELKPGLTYRTSDTQSEWVPSLDAFYKITPSLTGVLTLNTDFSGTEVDEVNMNMTRFRQYFTEKRDFFLQDSQVFNFGGFNDYDTNGMPFYSRRIGQGKQSGLLDVNWGTKVTGQLGDTRIGVLSVNQERDGQQEESTQLSVARVSHQLNSAHQVGAIVTDGSAADTEHSGLWGLDYRYDGIVLGDQRLEGNAWYQQAEHANPNADSKAYGAQVFLPNDAVYLHAKYRYIGNDFDPALGFVNRKGIKWYEVVHHLRHRPEQGILADYFNYVQFAAFYWQTDDVDNNLQSRQTTIRPLQLQFKDASSFIIQHETREEVIHSPYKMGRNLSFGAKTYEFSKWLAQYRSDTSKPIYGRVTVGKGEFFDSDLQHVSLDLNFKPNKYLSFLVSRQNYYYERDGLTQNMFGTRFRADVAFNSDWSWNTMLQHNTQSDDLSIFTRLRYQSRPDELYQVTWSKGYDLEDGWKKRETEQDETTLKLNYIFRW